MTLEFQSMRALADGINARAEELRRRGIQIMFSSAVPPGEGDGAEPVGTALLDSGSAPVLAEKH